MLTNISTKFRNHLSVCPFNLGSLLPINIKKMYQKYTSKKQTLYKINYKQFLHLKFSLFLFLIQRVLLDL